MLDDQCRTKNHPEVARRPLQMELLMGQLENSDSEKGRQGKMKTEGSKLAGRKSS